MIKAGCKGVGRNILLFSFTPRRHTEPLKVLQLDVLFRWEKR